MSKRLLITSTDLMMIQFLVPHVIYLNEHGFEIEIACSNVGNRIDEIRNILKDHINKMHLVRLVRSPASFINLKGYKDMKEIINHGNYDIIWTNEPVMGVVTRLAGRKARKKGTQIVYMVHGFHFYKGAPLINWIVYYPVERMASRFCDEIVTINHDDYNQARKLHAQKIEYIHGIGVDVSRLNYHDYNTDIRDELGLDKDTIILISVGELNENKNQQVIINALSLLKNNKIHYILCGKGEKLGMLQDMVDSLSLDKNVHFLGYRKDVVNICKQSDIFVFPSKREGLGLAPLEAMYCGLPLITSNIRGPRDFMENDKTGYLCKVDNVEDYANRINDLINNQTKRIQYGKYNQKVVIPFCLDNVKDEILNLLQAL